jgi:hypothetical protein
MQKVFSRNDFFVLFLILSATLLTACGGGGGSSATSVSPVELEIRDSIAAVATAIDSEDATAAMNGFDSNLKYYPTNPSVIGGYEDYNNFKTRLENFFSGAIVKQFTIETLGVDVGIETTAMARGTLSCSYTDSNGIDRQLTEQIEMKLERVGKWGITEIYAYDTAVGLTGMKFPPQP